MNRVQNPVRLSSVWIQPTDQEASMRVFIGLDVSLANTAICVVDRDGAVQWQGKVPSEPDPLIERLAEWSGVIDLAGIEACPPICRQPSNRCCGFGRVCAQNEG